MYDVPMRRGVASRKPRGEWAPGTVIDGRYRIDGRIGRGAMATVYDAEHLGLGRRIAIKVPQNTLEKFDQARFLREVRTLAAIDHPNVCRVTDSGVFEDAPVMVMERLEGVVVGDSMHQGRHIPVDEAIAITKQILLGLAAAHDIGALHRDVKPGNVMLLDRDVLAVKIFDFGLVKPNAIEPNEVTETGITVGTPLYMAPEQLRGRRDLDARCDVYGAGATLFHMLAGRPPFEDTGQNLLLRVARGQTLNLAEIAPSLSPELVEVVRRSMHLDREQRYETANDFHAALDALSPQLLDLTFSDEPDTMPELDTDLLPEELRKAILAVRGEDASKKS